MILDGKDTKYCKHCGGIIPKEAVLCTKCGRMVEEIRVSNPYVRNRCGCYHRGNVKNKWVAFTLCLFFGLIGGHKVYEGKWGSAILYLFTGGLFGFGWLGDLIKILCSPNPYYV